MKNRIIFLHSFLFAVTGLNGTRNAGPLKLSNYEDLFCICITLRMEKL